MAFTAKDVKTLRDMTGAGMMDCKKALGATDGNIDEAVNWLRENGLAKAAKKADRIAAEGLVAVDVDEDGKRGSIVEVNSETDFVAKNEKFQSYVASIAAQAKQSGAKNIEEFLAEKSILDPSMSVEDKNKEEVAVIGENLKIRRFAVLNAEDGIIVPYVHAGGRIGVLVHASTDAPDNADVKSALELVAMQVASMRPKYFSKNDVPSDWIDSEKEVLMKEAQNEKPNGNDKMWNGIVMGRLNKEFKEICLLDQEFVFAEDGKPSVEKFVADKAKELGVSLKLVEFVRFETGEGLEKKNEDFAAEVAAQMK
jgi:elongation factor Ts